MGWFERTYKRIKRERKVEVPDGLWTKCTACGKIIYNKKLEENLRVCPECGYHFYLGARERLKITLDEGTFREFDPNLNSANVLSFPGYEEKLKKGKEIAGLPEAIITGEGKIEGFEVIIAVTDFGFMGGSMGSVMGEKIVRATEKALEKKKPFLVISGSGGGARMQEGMLSLFQMAKTSTAISRLKEKGVLYISLLTHPTMGGVMASFASQGDIVLAEPGALLGFAGPRVIRQTIKHEMPKDFQRSESLLKHGMIDKIVPRKEIRPTLGKIFALLS